MAFDRQRFVADLRTAHPGIEPEAAERAADRVMGRTSGIAITGGEPQPPTAEEIAALEDKLQHDGEELMRALGFEVVHFSMKRASKQTPGIPDDKFYHRERRLTLWWEVKAEWGEQSPAQRVFQEMCEACGEIYVLGTLAILRTWLAGRRVCSFGVDNTPIPFPLEEQIR